MRLVLTYCYNIYFNSLQQKDKWAAKQKQLFVFEERASLLFVGYAANAPQQLLSLLHQRQLFVFAEERRKRVGCSAGLAAPQFNERFSFELMEGAAGRQNKQSLLLLAHSFKRMRRREIGFVFLSWAIPFSLHQKFISFSFALRLLVFSLKGRRMGKRDEMEEKLAALEWSSLAAEEPPAHNPLTSHSNQPLSSCLALLLFNEIISFEKKERAAGEEKKWNQFHQFHSFKRMEWNGFTFLPLFHSFLLRSKKWTFLFYKSNFSKTNEISFHWVELRNNSLLFLQ